MATQVSIVNNALTLLGANTIVNIQDDSEQARRANIVWSGVVDEVLESYPWNFAQERQTLALLSDAPNHEYSYAYQLPTNPYCLRVLELYNEKDNDIDYVIEGRKLLTDYAEAKIRYIKRITDFSNLPPRLEKAIIYKLASVLSYPLTGSTSKGVELERLFERVLRRSRSVDAKEGRSKYMPAGPWIKSKHGSKRFRRNL